MMTTNPLGNKTVSEMILEFLAQNGITYTTTHIRRIIKNNEEYDEWCVKIEGNGYSYELFLYGEKPKASTVLYRLLTHVDTLELTFEEWCYEMQTEIDDKKKLGYNNARLIGTRVLEILGETAPILANKLLG